MISYNELVFRFFCISIASELWDKLIFHGLSGFLHFFSSFHDD